MIGPVKRCLMRPRSKTWSPIATPGLGFPFACNTRIQFEFNRNEWEELDVKWNWDHFKFLSLQLTYISRSGENSIGKILNRKLTFWTILEETFHSNVLLGSHRFRIQFPVNQYTISKIPDSPSLSNQIEIFWILFWLNFTFPCASLRPNCSEWI